MEYCPLAVLDSSLWDCIMLDMLDGPSQIQLAQTCKRMRDYFYSYADGTGTRPHDRKRFFGMSVSTLVKQKRYLHMSRNPTIYTAGILWHYLQNRVYYTSDLNIYNLFKTRGASDYYDCVYFKNHHKCLLSPEQFNSIPSVSHKTIHSIMAVAQNCDCACSRAILDDDNSLFDLARATSCSFDVYFNVHEVVKYGIKCSGEQQLSPAAEKCLKYIETMHRIVEEGDAITAEPHWLRRLSKTESVDRGDFIKSVLKLFVSAAKHHRFSLLPRLWNLIRRRVTEWEMFKYICTRVNTREQFDIIAITIHGQRFDDSWWQAQTKAFGDICNLVLRQGPPFSVSETALANEQKSKEIYNARDDICKSFIWQRMHRDSVDTAFDQVFQLLGSNSQLDVLWNAGRKDSPKAFSAMIRLIEPLFRLKGPEVLLDDKTTTDRPIARTATDAQMIHCWPSVATHFVEVSPRVFKIVQDVVGREHLNSYTVFDTNYTCKTKLLLALKGENEFIELSPWDLIRLCSYFYSLSMLRRLLRNDHVVLTYKDSIDAASFIKLATKLLKRHDKQELADELERWYILKSGQPVAGK